ncbi:transcription factor DIVARICATA [Dorcoceras hygrometricum]|uniref:Transcription factor DIVARICATA n=1 Tax=Dorcoceras hygrometricum TaxID=472368 RepID=A0A2Z7D6M1_9LAMI|nr:transcription factor DIVARICATA [Dorcoceras hygrometricum]
MYANFPAMALTFPATWNRREDKIFENCLVEIPDFVENRWHMIARRIPGKSPEDVWAHYEALLFDVRQIDTGLVQPPRYPDETVTRSLPGDYRPQLRDPGQIWFASGPGRNRHVEVERKKGRPWTEEEHRLFLIGLKTYGRGDWRSISRNVVVTKTPTQVASHAQKYFLRQYSRKEKKRSSIHDITTATDSLTVPAQPNLPVPDQANSQSSQFKQEAM